MAKKLKNIHIRDLNEIQQLFYSHYDLDYWLYKINHLKDYHDKYDDLKKIFNNNNNNNISKMDGEKYKMMLRTELHFTYYQMIEALFELIFAVIEYENELWLALTFSNNRRTS